jgi:hypothetical protein
MWTEINRYLPKFKSAVLSGLDANGRPFSLRCWSQPNDVGELRLELPAYIPLEAGSASLLCHSHDERLWNLLSFVLRGRLEKEGQAWVFRPEQFIPGAGIGGLLSYVRFLRDGRRTTRRYLQKRGLTRPRVPWQEMQDIFEQARVDAEN